MPGEPPTQRHTGVEEPGAFGALPETATAEQSTGRGVCACLCASDRLVHHKGRTAPRQEAAEREEKSGDRGDELTAIPTVQARDGEAAAAAGGGWGELKSVEP